MAADLSGRYDALKYEPHLADFMDDTRVPRQAPSGKASRPRGPPPGVNPTSADGSDRGGSVGSGGQNGSGSGPNSGLDLGDSGHGPGPAAGPTTPSPGSPPSPMRGAGSDQRPGQAGRSAYNVRRSARYDGYVKSNYSRPGSRRFARMSRGRAGFGGVVFGNEVRKERGMRAPTRVSFHSDHLEITLRGGTKLRYGPISAEAARLGYALSHGSAHPVKKGEGIGLVGVQRVPIVRCEAETRMVDMSSSAPFEVIMHPALFDSLTGWASIRVDIAMSDPRDLLQRLQRHGGIQPQLQLLELHQRIGQVAVGTWKVVDVPMQIGRDRDRLTVIRAHEPGVHRHNRSLRQRAFIELRPVIETRDQSVATRGLGGDPLADYDRESARLFYELVPQLGEASPDFRRINELAAVLAIYRWAKQHRAKVSRPNVVHEETATSTAVYLDRGVVRPLSEQWMEGVRTDGRNALVKCMEELVDNNAQLKEIAEKYQIALLVGSRAMETLESLQVQGRGSTREAKEARETIEKVRQLWIEGPKIAQAQNAHDLVYWFELMGYMMGL